MESNKRLFIAFSITMILIVTILTSFGGNLFSSTTPSVTLPTITTSTEEISPSLSTTPLQRIEVSPETVQAVIASLPRPESYYRTFTTKLYWGTDSEESAPTTIEVWADSQITQVKKTIGTGIVRYDLIQDDVIYYWYEQDNSYFTLSPQDYAQDLAQFIPSYQSILNLDPQWIQEADYRLYNDVACIFVEALVPPLDFIERYWVQAETGLLLAAETYDQEQLIYRMEGFSPVSSYTAPSFLLPDGTVLS